MNGGKPSEQFESFEAQQGVEERPSEERVEERKKFRVAVYTGASPNEYSEINAGGAGKVIAKGGFGFVNGGYNLGGMKASSDAFDGACEEMGLTPEQIRERKIGILPPSKKETADLVEKGELISNAKFVNTPTIGRRGDEIIQEADAYIATEGGYGTSVEGQDTVLSQAFREVDDSIHPKPLIIIDKDNTIFEHLKLEIEKDPKNKSKMKGDIIILSGYTIGDGNNEVAANLENDINMQEKLKMILEYFFLKKIPKEALSLYEQEKIEILRYKLFPKDDEKKGEFNVMKLDEYLNKGQYSTRNVKYLKQRFQEGDGI